MPQARQSGDCKSVCVCRWIRTADDLKHADEAASASGRIDLRLRPAVRGCGSGSLTRSVTNVRDHRDRRDQGRRATTSAAKGHNRQAQIEEGRKAQDQGRHETPAGSVRCRSVSRGRSTAPPCRRRSRTAAPAPETRPKAEKQRSRSKPEASKAAEPDKKATKPDEWPAVDVDSHAPAAAQSSGLDVVTIPSRPCAGRLRQLTRPCVFSIGKNRGLGRRPPSSPATWSWPSTSG